MANISQDFLNKLEKYKDLINKDKWEEWQSKVFSFDGYNFGDVVEFGRICDNANIKDYFKIDLYYIGALNILSRNIMSNVEGKVYSSHYPPQDYIEYNLINEDGEIYIDAKIYFKENRIELFGSIQGQYGIEMKWNEFLDYFEYIIKENNIKISASPSMYKINLLG